jgi:hypothetical protein
MKPDIRKIKRLAPIPHTLLEDPWDESVVLILGKVRDDGSSTITGWLAAENVHPDPSSHYEVHIPKHDDRVIGVLHSHLASMKHSIVASDEDRAELPWWMIGGVYLDGKVRWFTSTAVGRPKRIASI